MIFTRQVSRFQRFKVLMVTQRQRTQVLVFRILGALQMKSPARGEAFLTDGDSRYPFDSRFFSTSSALLSCSSIWFFGFSSFLSAGLSLGGVAASSSGNP